MSMFEDQIPRFKENRPSEAQACLEIEKLLKEGISSSDPRCVEIRLKYLKKICPPKRIQPLQEELLNSILNLVFEGDLSYGEIVKKHSYEKDAVIRYHISTLVDRDKLIRYTKRIKTKELTYYKVKNMA